MKINQEPKYDININGKVLNRKTGIEIPDDEPIIIFRAKDKHARTTIAHYLTLCGDDDHKKAVSERLNDFIEFANNNPTNEPTS